MHPASSTVLVSIVNWRSAALTIDCLRSLAPEVASMPGARVVVVDNASPDNSLQLIHEAIVRSGWGDWVTVVASGRNGGFAAGNNYAIRGMLRDGPRTDYVLLLNPDTVARPGAVRELARFLDEHPKVGIAGGRCEDDDGEPQVCCFRFHNLVGEAAGWLRLGFVDRAVEPLLARMPSQSAPIEVDWVSGALMMVRTTVLEELGLLDEGYFLYYEETDFILRAHRAGWQCWHVPSSRALHLMGQTSGINQPGVAPRRLPSYWFEARRRYFVLNHGTLYAAATDLLSSVAIALWQLRCALQGRTNPDPPNLLRDFLGSSALWRGGRGLRPRMLQSSMEHDSS